MKLGLHLGYSGAHYQAPVELVQRAEQLGYSSVWTAEAYGTDAVTPLAFLAAKTERIKLGTAIMQLAARTPANAAMSAATIDAMAGGNRFMDRSVLLSVWQTRRRSSLEVLIQRSSCGTLDTRGKERGIRSKDGRWSSGSTIKFKQ